MKYAICLLLAANVAMCSSGQSAQLSGRIIHPLSDTVAVNYFDNFVTYAPKRISTLLDKNGRFTIAIPVSSKYAQVTYTNGSQETELFLSPADALTAFVDAAHFDSSLSYTGRGSEVNNFVAAHVRDRGISGTMGADVMELSTKSVDSFSKAVEAGRRAEEKYLSEYPHVLPADFRTTWNALIKYSFANLYLSYPIYHEAMLRGSYQVKDVPAINYSILNKVPYEYDDELLTLPPYAAFVQHVVNAIYLSTHAGDTSAYTRLEAATDTLVDLAYKLMPTGSAALYEAHEAHNKRYSSAAKMKLAIARLKARNRATQYLPILEKELTFLENTAMGKPAMNFSFTTIDGKKMQLSDFKGKVVLLDFWASWCGPCREEMKYAPQVHKQFEGKPVVFLYVSVDDDADKWKEAIKRDSISGLHTMVPGDFESPVAKLYNIQGVPTYYLLDKNGRFAVDEVPRPSSTNELIAAIQSLLK